MAQFQGPRGPNVQDYINSLNAMPSPPNHDAAAASAASAGGGAAPGGFNIEDDLAMFTNTHFFDFDLGQDADLQPASFDRNVSNVAIPPAEMKPMEFISADFSFPEFSTFPAQAYRADGMPQLPNAIPAHSAYPVSSAGGSPISGEAHVVGGGDKMMAGGSAAMSEAGGSLGSACGGDGLGPYDDQSRVAAEEDKRRRNTAASARFRVKKKQREAALERSAKEMSDKVTGLENRISQLETENKWLKNLITEKNENKDDIATLWKKYSQEAGDRKGATRKDGVGTGKA